MVHKQSVKLAECIIVLLSAEANKGNRAFISFKAAEINWHKRIVFGGPYLLNQQQQCLL